MMTAKQSIKIAIESIRHKMKELAFDANLYTVYGARTHTPIRAHKEYERLKQAIEVLSKDVRPQFEITDLFSVNAAEVELEAEAE